MLFRRMVSEDEKLSLSIEKVSSAAVLNQSFKIHPKAVLALKREGFSEEEIYSHKPRFKWLAWKDFKEADLIILSVGSLYTSVLPNVIGKDMQKAIKSSKAKIAIVHSEDDPTIPIEAGYDIYHHKYK